MKSEKAGASESPSSGPTARRTELPGAARRGAGAELPEEGRMEGEGTGGEMGGRREKVRRAGS